MTYRYEDLRDTLFTDEGQKSFLKIRDRSKKLLEEAGAFRLNEVLRGSSGDSWHDRGHIRDAPPTSRGGHR